MAEQRGSLWTITSGKRMFSPLRLCLSLFCVVLLSLQPGCGRGVSDTEAPVVEEEPAQITATAPPVEPAPVAAEAQPIEVEQAPVAQAAEGGPRITFDKVVYDFGEIGPETRHTGKFEFKNTGDAPLKIVRVRSCCGVATRGVKSGQIYAPGESGALELDYTATSHPGSMSRKLHIQSNDPKQSVVTLTIKAKIARRVEYEPKQLRLFLNKENAGCREITLTSVDGRPFSVTGFRSTANSITAEFDPTVEATKFVLQPQGDLEKLQRHLKGQISIDLTHPECKNVRLLYDVLPEFRINPPQILLFNLKEGQPVRRDVWVLSNYEDDFEIESVSSQKGTMKLLEKQKITVPKKTSGSGDSPVPGAGTRYQLQIEITPPPADGERPVLSDVLEVKLKDGETLSIQLRGFY